MLHASLVKMVAAARHSKLFSGDLLGREAHEEEGHSRSGTQQVRYFCLFGRDSCVEKGCTIGSQFDQS